MISAIIVLICAGCKKCTILSPAVALTKLASVTKSVLIMTAVSPKGAINKIISVIAPLQVATPKFLTNAARWEMYIFLMCVVDVF